MSVHAFPVHKAPGARCAEDVAARIRAETVLASITSDPAYASELRAFADRYADAAVKAVQEEPETAYASLLCMIRGLAMAWHNDKQRNGAE